MTKVDVTKDFKGIPITVGTRVCYCDVYYGTVKEIRPSETEYSDEIAKPVTKPPQAAVEFDSTNIEYYTAVSTMRHYNDPVEYCFEELEVVT
jgi:hypothetical protein